MNGKVLGGNSLQVDYYDRKQTMAFNNTTDVVGNENLRALFLKGIDKRVSFNHDFNLFNIVVFIKEDGYLT